jgi:hypothetical protein
MIHMNEPELEGFTNFMLPLKRLVQANQRPRSTSRRFMHSSHDGTSSRKNRPKTLILVGVFDKNVLYLASAHDCGVRLTFAPNSRHKIPRAKARIPMSRIGAKCPSPQSPEETAANATNNTQAPPTKLNNKPSTRATDFIKFWSRRLLNVPAARGLR